MPIPGWKLAHINLSATAAAYPGTDLITLTNQSRVVVNCGTCGEPKLHTTVVSMRVRSSQKRRGQTTYTPICPSCQAARNWTNNEFRQKQSSIQSARMREVWERDGYRENQSAKHAESSTQIWENDEYRAKIAQAIASKHANDPEYHRATTAHLALTSQLLTQEQLAERAHNAAAALQRPGIQAKMAASSLSHWTTEEFRTKITASNLKAWADEDRRQRAAVRTKQLWQDQDYRARTMENFLKAIAEPAYRQKLSEASRLLWKDPRYRELMAQARANQPRVSSIQQTLYKLLGDLDVPFLPEGPDTVIGHYVFDCVIPREGGGGILVECQGEYWHTLPGAVARDRSKFTYIDRYFPEHEILYLWEHEFHAKDRVLDRLKLKLGLEVPVAQFDFRDIRIREIKDAGETREFLDAYHYIGKGRGGLSYGAYHGENLVGVAVYSPPLRQNTAGQFGVESENCRELSRFCIHPSYHKQNFASWFIARTLRRVDAELVVAYADTTAGHHGTIYRAAGFELHHVVDPDYWYVDPEGFVMHKWTLYGRAKKLGMTEREYAETYSYGKKWGGQKHCFVKRK